MGLLSKVKALGSLTRKKKYSKQELAFIEEARRALIDWGVACETAGPAEVEALYLLEQRKVRIYVAGTDAASGCSHGANASAHTSWHGNPVSQPSDQSRRCS